MDFRTVGILQLDCYYTANLHLNVRDKLSVSTCVTDVGWRIIPMLTPTPPLCHTGFILNINEVITST